MPAGGELQLAGKVALVTGATSGIGLETAAALAELGATVVLGARNPTKAQETANLIRERHPGAKVEVGPELDLKSLDNVRKFVSEFEKQDRPLHILVNNAALGSGSNYRKHRNPALAGANFSRPWKTPEDVTGLVQVNYLGAFALTRLLEKKLIASSPARVVNVSRFALIPDVKEFIYNWREGRYAHTKLANALFSKELNRHLQPHGVESCAVDPGGVNSSIWDRGGALSRPPLRNIIAGVYAPPSDGAAAVVHAASSPWKSTSPADHFLFARGLFASPFVTLNPVSHPAADRDMPSTWPS